MYKYKIDRIWPVSTEVCPSGGIGIDWHGLIGFGQLTLYWGDDDKLHANTECLCSNDDKRFMQRIFNLLLDFIEVDD